jgi:hypothetical protein
MARRAAGGSSKSAAIRAYKTANPDAGPKEIAESLGKNGVKVSAAFVSTVLSNARRKARKGRRKGGRRGGRAAGDPFAHLVQAKRLSDQMGGVEKARAALDALARILS